MRKIKTIINGLSNNAYIFAIITKMVSVVLVMLYSIVYSRFFGPEIKGAGDVVLNYADFLKIIACLGMYQAYPFFKKNRGNEVYSEYINNTFGLFLIYMTVAITIVLVFRLSLMTAAIILLVPIMYAIQQLNYVVLIERPKTRNSAQVLLDSIDIVIVAILMLALHASEKLCIVYLVARHVIHLIVAIINLKIPFFSIRPTVKNASKYIQYGWIPMITILFMEINYKADVIMMESYRVSRASIGIYSLGLTLAQKIWLIPDALKDILISKLSNGKNIQEVKKVSRLSLFVVLLLILVLIIIGKPLILMLYGNEYKDAYIVLIILLLGVVGMVFYKMVFSFNVVNGKRLMNMILLGIAAGINIIANIFLIPSLGMIGAAIASTVSYFFCGLLFLVVFCKQNSIKAKEMIVVGREDIKNLKRVFSK